jgi:hypothetical protein
MKIMTMNKNNNVNNNNNNHDNISPYWFYVISLCGLLQLLEFSTKTEMMMSIPLLLRLRLRLMLRLMLEVMTSSLAAMSLLLCA